MNKGITLALLLAAMPASADLLPLRPHKRPVPAAVTLPELAAMVQKSGVPGELPKEAASTLGFPGSVPVRRLSYAPKSSPDGDGHEIMLALNPKGEATDFIWVRSRTAGGAAWRFRSTLTGTLLKAASTPPRVRPAYDFEGEKMRILNLAASTIDQ